jgi:hypothetical protein
VFTTRSLFAGSFARYCLTMREVNAPARFATFVAERSTLDERQRVGFFGQ